MTDIAALTYKIDTTSLKQAETALNRFSAAQKKAAASAAEFQGQVMQTTQQSGGGESPAKRQADDIEKLKAKYNALFASQQKYIQQLAKIRSATTSTTAAQKTQQTTLTGTAASLSAATAGINRSTTALHANSRGINTNRMHALNMQYQLNDIAVGLSTGQSPFTVLMQQGMQMSQIFAQTGQTGVRGAIQLVKTSFMSMMNPVNMVIIGLAAAAAAIAWFATRAKDVEDVTVVMERHSKVMVRIRDAYGDSIKGIRNFARESKELAKSLALIDKIRLGALFADQLETLMASIRDFNEAAIQFEHHFGGSGTIKTYEWEMFEAFGKQLNDFRASVIEGTPDVQKFQLEVAKIASTTADKKIQDMGLELLEMARAAGKSALGLTALQDVLDRMTPGGDPALGAVANDRVSGAFQRLEIEKFLERLRSSVKTPSDKKSPYEREIESIHKKVEALRIEAATFGMTEAAAKRYEVVQTLIARANESKIKVTPELMEAIRAEADAYADAMEKVKALNDEKERAEEITKNLSSLLYGAVKGANSFADAMKRLADSIADAALEAALMGTGPLAALFGLKTSDGSPGGLFGKIIGALVGGATGGATGPPEDFGLNLATGGSFTVGGSGGTDSQPVKFMATPGERVDVLTPGQQMGGGPNITINQNNDFRGVDATSRAFLIAQLERSQRQTIELTKQAVFGEGRLNPAYRRG